MNTTRTSLLIRIKDRGDCQAWTEFDAIYRPILLRYSLSHRLDEADAEDVVQHCMAAVQKHIGDFEYDPSKGRFRSWLRTIANNHIRSLCRKRREPIADSGVLGEVQNRDTSPEDAFARLWMEEHLKHCLNRLRAATDPLSFRAYCRYVIDEWPVRKVCQELRIDQARLYKIKWRLTHKLEQHMQDLLGVEGDTT